jgi:hypothetical protein
MNHYLRCTAATVLLLVEITAGRAAENPPTSQRNSDPRQTAVRILESRIAGRWEDVVSLFDPLVRDRDGQENTTGQFEQRAWLGLQIQSVTGDLARSLGMGEPSGALVGVVDPEGPAAHAGVKSGDIVVQFNERRIDDASDLPEFVRATPIGKRVTIHVLRGGKVAPLYMTVAAQVGGAAKALNIAGWWQQSTAQAGHYRRHGDAQLINQCVEGVYCVTIPIFYDHAAVEWLTVFSGEGLVVKEDMKPLRSVWGALAEFRSGHYLIHWFNDPYRGNAQWVAAGGTLHVSWHGFAEERYSNTVTYQYDDDRNGIVLHDRAGKWQFLGTPGTDGTLHFAEAHKGVLAKMLNKPLALQQASAKVFELVKESSREKVFSMALSSEAQLDETNRNIRLANESRSAERSAMWDAALQGLATGAAEGMQDYQESVDQQNEFLDNIAQDAARIEEQRLAAERQRLEAERRAHMQHVQAVQVAEAAQREAAASAGATVPHAAHQSAADAQQRQAAAAEEARQAEAERRRLAEGERERREEERRAQQELAEQKRKQALEDHLAAEARSIRLRAEKCAGDTVALGIRPRITPRIANCISVHYEARCPGVPQGQGVTGALHNYVGGDGCTGDWSEIPGPLNCPVETVKVDVLHVTTCP